MSNFAPERTEYGSDDTRWLRNALAADTHGITLEGSSWTSDPAGILIPSGTHVSELGGPYQATTEETQTVTISGGPTGGSFTLTFSGQTTTAIPHNATAAAVQAALADLSTIGQDVHGVDNVQVTGSAGGPWTVKFVGDLANENVAQLSSTSSLTGGSSPAIAHATSTAGGSAVDSPSGSGKTEGHLRSRIRVKPGQRYLVAVVHSGSIDRRYLPAGNHDAAAESQLTAIAYFNNR